MSLAPTVGSGINKSRPCIVVSPPKLHDHLRTVIVAPMTTKSRPAPFRIPVTHGGKRGLILLDQVRADKTRFVWRRSWEQSFSENTGSHLGYAARSVCRVIRQFLEERHATRSVIAYARTPPV